MSTRDRLKVWNTALPTEHEALLDEGKQIELIAGDGMLILQRDEQGKLHFTWLHESQVGFGMRIGTRR